MGGSPSNWATSFTVLAMLILVMDKSILAAYFMCEEKIKYLGVDGEAERAIFKQFKRLMETELFEKCKEIFHARFRTKRGNNMGINPIRNGTAALRVEKVHKTTEQLIHNLQRLVRDFRKSSPFRLHIPGLTRLTLTARDLCNSRPFPYETTNGSSLGRLAGIFLSDFLGSG